MSVLHRSPARASQKHVPMAGEKRAREIATIAQPRNRSRTLRSASLCSATPQFVWKNENGTHSFDAASESATTADMEPMR